MPRRKPDVSCDVLVSFRVTAQMKDDIDASAAAKNISNTEWLRRAVQNELNREANGGSEISDSDLRETIRSVVEEMLEEKKKAGER